MDNKNKLKNIFTFLSILFVEDIELASKVMNMSPAYIIEKWERYIESIQEDNHLTGMHPMLTEDFFNVYFKKWKVEND